MLIKKKSKLSSDFFKTPYLIYIIFILFFISGFIFHSSNIYKLYVWPELIKITSINNKISDYVTNRRLNDLENIYIDINFKNLEKLNAQRVKFNNVGFNFSDSTDYFNAKIRIDETTRNIKIKIKGKNDDHWNASKPSYRIKVKDNKTFFDMRTFSLQAPIRRGLVREWLYHKVLKKEKIISLRYKFINLYLNGVKVGIYNIEEGFDKKILIENNERREGPIIRFNDELQIRGEVTKSSYLSSYHSSNIKPYNKNKIFKNQSMKNDFINAFNKLNGFQSGHLELDEVFDVDILSKYHALNDILLGSHTGDWSDLRFYYNPLTTFLEPIGYDATDIWLNKNELLIEGLDSKNELIKDFFSNNNFTISYLKYLYKFSRKDYLDDLFNLYGEKFKNLNKLLLIDNQYSLSNQIYFNNDLYFEKQEKIRKFFNPYKSLHAYKDSIYNDYIFLNIANIQSIPIIIKDIYKDGKKINFQSINYIMKGRDSPDKKLVYKKIKFNIDTLKVLDPNFKNLTLSYEIFGVDSTRIDKVNSWSNNLLSKKNFINQIYKPNIKRFNFLSILSTKSKILFNKKKCIISEDLIIPSGFLVEGFKGLEIEFKNNSKIISFSPMIIKGTKNEPIKIFSSGDDGGGIISIINANGLSKLQYIKFYNLSKLNVKDDNFTGIINCYESDLNIDNCSFENNNSEDFLNIIRSEFIITNCNFKNIYSDAFDSDFSKGEIKNSSFYNCGNDAIDISGSSIFAKDIIISKIVDKGISIGEKSNFKGQNIKIFNTNIGIANKDLSTAEIDSLDLSKSNVGVACYQKKDEFGPSKLRITEGVLYQNHISFACQMNSSLWFNNKEISPVDSSEESLLQFLE